MAPPEGAPAVWFWTRDAPAARATPPLTTTVGVAIVVVPTGVMPLPTWLCESSPQHRTVPSMISSGQVAWQALHGPAVPECAEGIVAPAQHMPVRCQRAGVGRTRGDGVQAADAAAPTRTGVGSA
jgi:hypothetical protein